MDEKVEQAARKVLGLPRFPDTATGPRSAALLAAIAVDRKKLGDAKAIETHLRLCAPVHAGSITTDPAHVKAAYPAVAGLATYPVSADLATASKDPERTKACTVAEKTALDAAVAAAPKPTTDPKVTVK